MKATRTLWWGGTAVVALLAAAACWFLALAPVLDEAGTATTEAEATEGSNDTRRLEVARLAAERENLPALEAELAELRRQFPTDLELPAFVQRLADLSARSGAVVSAVNRSDPVESEADGSGRVYRVDVRLTVEGLFEQQLQYLSDLQGIDDRLFLVTAAGDLGTEAMVITGSTFVLVDADAVRRDDTGGDPGAAEEAAEADDGLPS